MTLDKILNTEIKDFTLEEVNIAIKYFKWICDIFSMTPQEINFLFSYMCVKDKQGVWRGLTNSNYKLEFEYGTGQITLIPHEVWIDNDHKMNLYDKYVIRGYNSDEYKTFWFPEYTGYEKTLNEKESK